MLVWCARVFSLGFVALGVSACSTQSIRKKQTPERVAFEGTGRHLRTYGVVVGLPGTGDTETESTENVGRYFDSSIDWREACKARKVALVLVTATLEPSDRQRCRIDVFVTPVVDASSVVGGTLLPLELYGWPDKSLGKYYYTTYAVASGRVIAANNTMAGTIPMGGAIAADFPD